MSWYHDVNFLWRLFCQSSVLMTQKLEKASKFIPGAICRATQMEKLWFIHRIRYT